MLRKMSALILLLLLCVASISVFAEDQIPRAGNWPDGDFFAGLRFYGSAQDVEDAGWIDKDRSKIIDSIGATGTTPVLFADIDFKLLVLWSDSSSVSVFLTSDPLTIDDAVSVSASAEDEIRSKWGEPTEEQWQKNGEDSDPFDIQKSLQESGTLLCSTIWKYDPYIANLVIVRNDEEEIHVNINFTGTPYYDDAKTAYFRNTKWGMTRDEVRQSEPDLLFVESEGMLIAQNVRVANSFDATAIYSFDANDRLSAGGYVFSEKHTNDNDYIDDYDKLKNQLTKKYGNPYFDDVNWKNDLYQKKPQDYGFAVSLGHLEYNARYYAGRTHIALALNGDNYAISMLLLYADRVGSYDAIATDDSGL